MMTVQNRWNKEALGVEAENRRSILTDSNWYC